MVRRPRIPGPNDIRELNDRLTKAGEDLKDAYNLLRRGGAPIPDETMDAIDEIQGIPLERRATDPRGIATAFASVDRNRLQAELDRIEREEGEGPAELAYLDLREFAEETEDQELENALASIGADVPRDFSDARFQRRKSNGREVIRRSGQFSRQNLLPRIDPPKKKRKVSKYQKEFGKQLKKLKKKHPRTKITRLMKRAHAATRKAMK